MSQAQNRFWMTVGIVALGEMGKIRDSRGAKGIRACEHMF
jgi:hypothetical protein